MFESIVKNLKKGAYKIFPAEFDDYELIDVMAPSFIVGIFDEGYTVIFDPRSVIIGTSFTEDVSDDVKKEFEELIGEDVNVRYTPDYSKDNLMDDVNFYQEMGTIVVESSERKVSDEDFKKILDRFKIFRMIAQKAKDYRYSIHPNMFSVSPGMAGLSVFITLDTKFMIWLKNETEIEGEKFKYGLIRAFNIVVAALARKFGYERMMILPYESLLILSRDVGKVERFLKTVDVVNEKIRDFLVENFGDMLSDVKRTVYDMGDIFKSEDAFFEYLSALPDKKALSHFKERLVSSIEGFCYGLEKLSRSLQEWIEKLVEEVC